MLIDPNDLIFAGTILALMCGLTGGIIGAYLNDRRRRQPRDDHGRFVKRDQTWQTKEDQANTLQS